MLAVMAPDFDQRRIQGGPGHAVLPVRHIDPAAHGEPVLARPGQLVDFRPNDRPGNVHPHRAAGHVESEAQMHAFLLTHCRLVERIDDVHPVQPVDHANLAAQLRAAGRVGLDEQ